jgi:thioredoxin
MDRNETSVVDREDFERRVLQSPTPVLVDFRADWCQPCRMVDPVIEGLAAEYGERLAVAKVDIDENAAIAAEYSVRSIPTVMLVANGAIRRVLVGSRSAQEYRAAIDDVLH